MAKDRQTPCIFYVAEHICEKGREGTHRKYCRRCSLYEPQKWRTVEKRDRRKDKREKARDREFKRGLD